MDIKTFNRHEIFNEEIMNTMTEILEEVQENARQRQGGWWTMLSNQLNGLYDGYLYGNIFQLAEEEQVPEATVAKIKGVVEQIERHIEINGQTEMLIF